MENRARLLTCIMVALLVSLSGRAAWAQAPEPCRLQRLAALDISYDRAGRPVIPASIDGKAVNLMVDTAGLFTSLEETKARGMGLHLQPITPQMIFMFDGTPVNSMANASNILIGRVPLKEFGFMIFPKGRLPDGVDGTLGPDILSHLDLDFDFAANKLNLISPSKCGAGVVYWADDASRLPFKFDDSVTNTDGSRGDLYNIRTPGQLDGTDVKITIDTGSSASVMTMAQAKFLFHWNGEPPELKKIEQPGGSVYYTYPFKTLMLNGITISDPQIAILQMKGDTLDQNSDMILGMNVLRQLHLYIAYNQRLIYATAPQGTKTETPPAKAN